MNREALNKWTRAALDLDMMRSSFAAPMHVLMSETVDLVRFCRDHWCAVKDGASVRPGLGDSGSQLPEHIADELLELEDALHTAHTEYLLTIPPIHANLRKRAELVLSELVAAIEWLLDDGQRDECDQQLAMLREEHAPLSNNMDSLGAQLADYAALASKLRPRLSVLVGFKMSLIDDAHHLARELRQLCHNAAASENTARALNLRNRIATLLVDRMVLVRTVATSVYRNHSAIAQLAASHFDLRQRPSAQRQPAEAEVIVERAEHIALS